MRVKNTFIQGKMNKDVDERLLPEGQYPHAENVRVSNSESSDIGAIENVLGNRALTTLSIGQNPRTIFQVEDSFTNTIYWGVKSDSGSYVIEHNTDTNTTSFVLRDERTGDNNVLNFNENFIITDPRILVDSDNNRRFLFLSDNNTFIKQINIERAKTYALNGFTEDDISLIKKPPLNPPSITLSETVGATENNIEERFLVFAYRYRYLDGEYSSFSPFSEVAFLPEMFNYNFSTGTNESMINAFNRVNISINTGSSLVTTVDIIFKEITRDTPFLVGSFNKSEESWGNNETQQVQFVNNKVAQPLPVSQLNRLFDNVPRKAKSLELIGNRLVLGNYTENYNMVDSQNNAIVPEFSVTGVTQNISSGTPTRTLKSNRDYEIGVVYGDEYGRLSTVFTSKDNTYHVPNTDSIRQNQLRVTVSNRPPEFASFYRFYIKQTRTDYDVIVPTLFYQDGSFVWVKIENSDINKVSEGDVLIVKSDTRQLLPSGVRTKILEITNQPRNFLETTPTTELRQLAGTYAKINPVGFNLRESDLNRYLFRGYDDSDGSNDPIGEQIPIVQPPSYYGTGTSNDLTSSGTFTGTADERYLVEIDSVGDGTTTFDTFRWSKDNGATFEAQNVAITQGTAQNLDLGVQVTFASRTGHSTSDRWFIGAKAPFSGGLGTNENSRAYAIFAGDSNEVIRAGARIDITYDEYNEEVQFVQKSYVSSRGYDNLEEWFIGDNIINDFGIPANRIWFRRGVIGTDAAGNAQINVNNDSAGRMSMIIQSLGFENSGFDRSPRIQSTLMITQTLSNVLFETVPTEIDTNAFYEIGRTYPIVNGFHTSTISGDTNQTATQDAVLTLPIFNAYSWGNGFESIKIRDLFNANRIDVTTRASQSIEDYRENIRIASLTYSQVYEQSTNYNGINEFNLSTNNFKDMDDAYGSIQKLWSRDTDLLVFQEDKTHKVLYNKSVLFNADGTGNVSQNSLVLGQEIGYAGEYGISLNPESFAIYGNYIWHTDTRRGCILRLTNNGYYEISSNGMRDYFRDYFRNNIPARKYGMYDPYHDQYVLSTRGDEFTVTYDEELKGWSSFHSFIPDGMVNLNNRFYTIKDGQLYVHNDETVNRNTYYGTFAPSRISLIVNTEPSVIKDLHAINIEGSEAWNMVMTSYISNTDDIKRSNLNDSEFVQKEGLWYAYARRNELPNFESKAAYGIGSITSISGNTVTINGDSTFIGISDNIFNSTNLTTAVGTISSLNVVSDTSFEIVLSDASSLGVGNFLVGVKNNRYEGGNLRGYSLRYDMTNNTSNRSVELYAVNSEINKSYSS